ncbi:hypothetical protein CVT25_014632 [Psilocybe cyanescens]|uniref:Uncharacterized protein n=1 Tax=Psilocybe cyanescens TaxID=93625 RepID=A0A409WU46_PSICY|nr:hypothetical protein CVT25_014632 [Psilocybe cyanescens]
MASRAIERVPIEVWDNIIDLLAEGLVLDRRDRWQCWRDLKSARAAFWQLSGRAHYYLYRNIWIRGYPGPEYQAEYLMQFCKTVVSSGSFDVLQSLRKVRLDIQLEFFFNDEEYPADAMAEAISIFIDVIAQAPNLQQFIIGDDAYGIDAHGMDPVEEDECEADRFSDWEELPPSVRSSLWKLVRLPSLKTFGLYCFSNVPSSLLRGTTITHLMMYSTPARVDVTDSVSFDDDFFMALPTTVQRITSRDVMIPYIFCSSDQDDDLSTYRGRLVLPSLKCFCIEIRMSVYNEINLTQVGRVIVEKACMIEELELNFQCFSRDEFFEEGSSLRDIELCIQSLKNLTRLTIQYQFLNPHHFRAEKLPRHLDFYNLETGYMRLAHARKR